MNRPTIADLAEAAGVSVSTVNRILGGTASVRGATVQRVQAAAERIGFYGIGAIEDRMRKTAPNYRLGFLLQQSKRELYQLFSKKIIAACRDRQNEAVDPLVDFVDLLTPENIAARLMALGRECDAVAVIAADHPVISQTIRELREMGKPVISYITDQSAPERAAYVGTDNWKLGRTAAWLIAQTTQGPGRIPCSSTITAINARISRMRVSAHICANTLSILSLLTRYRHRKSRTMLTVSYALSCMRNRISLVSMLAEGESRACCVQCASCLPKSRAAFASYAVIWAAKHAGDSLKD